jgi:hypothetical protein
LVPLTDRYDNVIACPKRSHTRSPSNSTRTKAVISPAFRRCPDAIPGGASYEAAVKNAEEALLGYLEALQKNGEAINNHGNRCLPSS